MIASRTVQMPEVPRTTLFAISHLRIAHRCLGHLLLAKPLSKVVYEDVSESCLTFLRTSSIISAPTMRNYLRIALLLLAIFGGHACKHVANKTTFNDRRCSDLHDGADKTGCNAGGQGRNCRFCGFDQFPACPTPAPIPSNDSVFLGK